MNETLEAMARALFKSWFVDFETRRPRRRPRGLDRDRTASSQRAGDSEWKYPAESRHQGLPVIEDCPAPERQHRLGSDLASDDLGDDYVVNDGDDALLVVRLASSARSGLADAGRSTNTSSRSPPTRYPKWFVLLLDSRASRRVPPHRGRKSNDDGPHPAASPFRRESARSASWCRRGGRPGRLRPMFDRLLNLAVASLGRLAALRDALLPKLISGELRVGDAERVAAAAP